MAVTLYKRVVRPALHVAVGSPARPVSEANGDVLTASGVTERVLTSRFGVLEVDPDLVLTFPEGLIGFEDCKRYIVAQPEESSAFRWLQSLEQPNVAFPIMEPGAFRPDYAPTITDTDARALEMDRETPTLVFVIITIPVHEPRAMTANLLGPLVINARTRQGKQCIVQEDRFTTRHKVVDELLRMTAVARAGISLPAEAVAADDGNDAPDERKANGRKPARAA